MVGLREKKKKESEAKILRVAKDIFTENGYVDTTMEMIAARAEMGVGTLYNYFPSKAEIYIEIMSSEVAIDDDDNYQLQLDMEDDIANIVIDYLQKALRGFGLISKKMWRELMAVAAGSMKTDNVILKGLTKLDLRYIDKLEHILESAKEKKKLPSSFDVKEGAYAIYSVILTQFFIYLYVEDSDLDQLTVKIENQIRFIFKGKCIDTKLDSK